MEARFGANMQYRKSLKMQVLLENQMNWDGNRIDNGFDLGGTNTDFPDGRNVQCEGEIATTNCLQRNTWNLERLWIEYTMENTPLRFLVGADLWTTDPAGVIGDDDPRAIMFAKFGNLELSAGIVMQTSSLRAGLTNDNDDMYYTFGATYDMKPWRFAVDASYFRFRFRQNQEVDTAIIMPSAVGSVGMFSFLVQPMFVFGSVDANNGPDYDVAAFGFIGNVELNLGKVRPFLSVVYGSGDDNPNDGDLEAFSPLPQPEITLTTGRSQFSVLTNSASWGARDVFPPAAVNLGGGFEYLHSVGNPWSDRVGQTLNTGVTTTYGNPGVLLIAPGAKIALAKGHSLDVFYIYRRVMDTEPIEQELLNREGVAVNVDESMTHELAAQYSWTPNPYFDVRLYGGMVIPSDGVKDVASAQVCNTATGARCEGEDVALYGELRVRSRF
jgi:hypothetical protein